MKGIVLAAGDGGRLRPLSDTRPKVLLPMLGKPLIAYPVDSLVWAGITEIGVVVGYRAPQLEEALSTIAPAGIQLTVIHNPDFEGGNALSIKAAADFVGDEHFVLCMGDHVIDRTFVSRVTGGDESEVVLAVDSEASLDSQLNDATRVQVDPDGRLIRIGKGLRQWNAVDTGVFRFAPSVFKKIDALHRTHGDGLELNIVMQSLAFEDPGVSTRDVEGLFWSDVDTVEDYRTVGDHLEDAYGIGV